MDKSNTVCEIFAEKIGLLFNPIKSKSLLYKVYDPDTVYLTSRNTTFENSLHEQHLDNSLSNNIYNRHIKEYVCIFFGNIILCDFGCCDSNILREPFVLTYMAVSYEI